MKKKSTLIALLFIASVFTMIAQETAALSQPATVESVTSKAKAKWDTKILDLGEIEYRVPTTAEFTLTNTGSEPLLITYAKASCGCTNLKYDKEPIMPGKTSKLSVTYNGSGNGDFKKNITVQTNADKNRAVLQIKGKVIKE